MRKLRYLSPTSVAQFYANREEFYLQRLSESPPDRLPQTQPMSIGSAFDAYVKNYLHKKLYGESDAFALRPLFEKQVDKQHWPWAWENGKYVFESYKRSGALAALMVELEKAGSTIRFEGKVEGNIPCAGIPDGIPMLGYPDMDFRLPDGQTVVLDWKVNGYCGKARTSPKPGYINVTDGWEGKPTRTSGSPHGTALVLQQHGLMINVATTLDQIDLGWGSQVAIYSWLIGAEVGHDIIVGIDQLVSCGANGANKPKIRVARHRYYLKAEFQLALLATIKKCWLTCAGGWIFDDMTRAESDARCAQLDRQAAVLDAQGEWFKKMARRY